MSNTEATLPASERLLELHRCLESRTGFDQVLAALDSGGQATVDGVWGSSCALLAAALTQHAPGPLLVVVAKPSRLDDLSDDLSLFTQVSSDCFPAWESEPGERILVDEIYGDRLRLLKMLAGGDWPPIILTSIQSLLQPVPRRENVAANTRRVRTGDQLDGEELKRWLAEHRFHSTSAVELPGEFAARGGVIDVFAPDWFDPVRIELFGDQVESIRQFDISSQRSSGTVDEIDITILAASSGDQDHLASYLPPNSWAVLVDLDEISVAGCHYLERLDQPQQFHSVERVWSSLGQLGTVNAAPLATGSIGAACHLGLESVERFSGDLQKIRVELDAIGHDQDVCIACSTEAEAERLAEVFAATQLAASGRLHFSTGSLTAGFRLPDEQLIVLSGAEMFQRTGVKRLPSRRLGKAIDTFLDLRESDLVVHLAHGIGRYRGLRLLDKGGQVEEHLEIEFHGGTRIYVPSSKIDLVQKYVGSAKSRPSLARIGGRAWIRQKQAAEQAVVDMAAEMLETQAARAARPGIAFNADSHWQQEFEAAFVYQETPDQLDAVQHIKSDMLSARPMDRLLCGDVGFGKTELAIRAAFKAVDSGFQVAILVPTTILAEQHFRTFQERMAEFPFAIAKLSRFSTPQEQQQTVAGLRNGQIDIVVGTHRLASKDVSFQNLGLVMIDEEQRFGVEVKERLKTMRTVVDILTMTATPIPRTLHMSMVGMRDISNLQTPPEDRIAVETRVCRFQNELIRHAIKRELNRGGQVYFVHNRIGDIEILANKLRQTVPEADIRIAHGQMPEAQLERVMVDFVAGSFDVLLATTIVESGLDIPNANTMFIDEANRYGLADLHQLRGRVGRYKHRAYCYLLIDPGQNLTPGAARRLRAIEEFSDMGAGFAIAMRDLEIRGAGNLLGTEQSGHIAAIGYEMYCELLESAVRKLQRLPPKLTIDVTIDLPGEAYLPQQYVPDMRLKIDLYRRLTRVASDEQLVQFREDLADRFGNAPDPVQRMFSLTELRMDAAVWQVDTITMEDRYVVFTYTNRQRIEQLAKLAGGKLRVVDDRSAYLTLRKGVSDPDQIIGAAKSVLRSGS